MTRGQLDQVWGGRKKGRLDTLSGSEARPLWQAQRGSEDLGGQVLKVGWGM